ncbi:MAG TPA: hypothetical protein VFQ53_11210 [Kofleriaceae bacterium]|nr:hypothetical protein [Kofleriaceae bacterium]
MRAAAHVAPSVDDNNRYLKITVLGDRVRLAYTVFFGEVPGQRMRPSLDANHDGTISDAESQAFGAKLGAEVAANLELELDREPRKIEWMDISVGLGTPSVRGGAFSVDLVAYACLTSRDPHALKLRDRFRVPNPGDTELKLEDSPGVTIQHARIGRIEAPDNLFKFIGPGGPLSDDGLDLAFTVSAHAPRASSPCAKPTEPTSAAGMSRAVIVIAAAVIGFALAALATVISRRRRARATR